MINEDRVKDLYKLCIYDEQMDKKHRNTGRFYLGDYVGRELLKSFFAGTLCFLLLFVLWAIAHWEAVQSFITKFDTENIASTFSVFGLIYLGFMILYLFVTGIFYYFKFQQSRKSLQKYQSRLKRLNKNYEREDKHKA